MTVSEVGTQVVVEVVKIRVPMSRDTSYPCHYARSMKANLLDDGIGDTLVSQAFDDVTLISHGKRMNLGTRIKEFNPEPSIGNGEVGERTFVGIWSDAAMSGKAQFRVILTMCRFSNNPIEKPTMSPS